jgi:hypothetical protein
VPFYVLWGREITDHQFPGSCFWTGPIFCSPTTTTTRPLATTTSFLKTSAVFVIELVTWLIALLPFSNHPIERIARYANRCHGGSR